MLPGRKTILVAFLRFSLLLFRLPLWNSVVDFGCLGLLCQRSVCAGLTFQRAPPGGRTVHLPFNPRQCVKKEQKVPKEYSLMSLWEMGCERWESKHSKASLLLTIISANKSDGFWHVRQEIDEPCLSPEDSRKSKWHTQSTDELFEWEALIWYLSRF